MYKSSGVAAQAVDIADRTLQHPATKWTYNRIVRPTASLIDRAFARIPSALTLGAGWTLDRGLNMIDRIPGVPSNVITPIRAGLAYHLPSVYSYTPAQITASNFDDEEQVALLDMLKSNGYRSLDAKAINAYLAKNKGRGYGSMKPTLRDRISDPVSVIETTLGQAGVAKSESGVPARVVDTYDFNVKSNSSMRDWNMYLNRAGDENAGAYTKLRAVIPKYMPKDTDPDDVKIKADISIQDLMKTRDAYMEKKKLESSTGTPAPMDKSGSWAAFAAVVRK